MIGLDTNVLVRYLVQDDRNQAAAATRLIESECSADTPGWIDQIVLCELVWVLDSAYGYTRPLIANTIRDILSTAELRAEGRDQVRAALTGYEEGKADLADVLIGIRNRDSGCVATFTFDRKSARLPTHRALK